MVVPPVEKYAPILVFGKDEQYLPSNLFFAGEDIIDNKQEYDKLSESQKLGEVCCYYHIGEGQRFTVYQYWYYYAYNEYALLPGIKDNHEHDFECFKVFVDKETGQPKIITCNIHFFREITPVDGDIPKIKVERGGHGLFTKNMRWRWDRGRELWVRPAESCEELRRKMMPFAPQLIDTDFKLIGNDYDWLRIGKLAGPQVPWARSEYYLPEKTLYGLDKRTEVDLSEIPGIGQPLPYIELVETMRGKPKELEKHRQDIVKRVRKDITSRSAYSPKERKDIVRALSDSKTRVPEGLKKTLLEQTGPILVPQIARDPQEAITIGRQYGTVTKQQYERLRYAGVRLKEEEKLEHLEWRIK